MKLTRSSVTTGGILFACALFAWNVRDVGRLAWMKVTGQSPCPWPSIRSTSWAKASVSLLKTDGRFELVQTPERPFWIRGRKDGEESLAGLIEEHRWTFRSNPDKMVRSGDVVLDCGAHVGVFTHFALKAGASKVYAIEPDPDNIEALRRNFPDEIAVGKVVVVPLGVWNVKDTLRFTVGNNSVDGSIVLNSGSQQIEIPVDTIDAIAANLGIPKVSYIKMDIEGSERKALLGAASVLAKDRPRLMISGYHLPDDYRTLPAIISSANDYRFRCGPCFTQSRDGKAEIAPHVFYFD